MSTLRLNGGLWTKALYQVCFLTATASAGPMMTGGTDVMGNPWGTDLGTPD
jgi:hypothetical protein